QNKVPHPRRPVLPADHPFFLAGKFFHQRNILRPVPEIRIVIVKENDGAYTLIPRNVHRLTIYLYKARNLETVFNGTHAEMRRDRIPRKSHRLQIGSLE